MRFSDIPTSILTIRVKRTDSYDTALEEQPVFSIVPCPSRPGEFEVGLKGSMAIFKPVRDVDGRRLNAELQGGRAVNIAQLANPAADGSIEVQIALFTGECVLMGDVDVGIDEYTERRYAKLFKSDISRERPFNALTEKCCYTHGDKPYFFFLAGPAVERILRTAVDEAGDSYGEHDDREDRLLMRAQTRMVTLPILLRNCPATGMRRLIRTRSVSLVKDSVLSQRRLSALMGIRSSSSADSLKPAISLIVRSIWQEGD